MSNKALHLLPEKDLTYDIVSLGEVMLRLDPGDRRIRTTRKFDAWEGGGEYNVARGLRRVFGKKGAIVTALADNEVGRLVEDFIINGGLDTKYIQWRDYDGIGREVRNGLNFTERGFGVRGAVGMSDRGNTAISQMKPDDVDWDELFGSGVRWLHTGGIFAALSENSADVAEAAMTAAKKHGTIVSYDLNFRPSLWKSIGGTARAQEVNQRLAKLVDVMIGNEEDFTASLGFEIEGTDEHLSDLDSSAFRKMIETAAEAYPNFKVVGTTLRGVKTATINDWGAVAWSREEGFVEAKHRPLMEIYDRVGGGDSFASGLIYGLMELDTLQQAVDYGAAHAAIAMTTPGDTSTANLAEVKKLAGGGSARVDR